MNFARDVKKAKATIEKTFIDKMSVRRYIKTVDPVTRRSTDKDELLYENEPCFISYTLENNDNPTKMTDANIPVLWKPLILCKLELDIKAGDNIIVNGTLRGEAIIKGKASDICPMLTHKEFSIGVDKET